MPAELPGFYFDAERNRYFPLGSKPREPQRPQQQEARGYDQGGENDTENQTTGLRRPKQLWRLQENVKWNSLARPSSRDFHDILCASYAQTSRMTSASVPTFGSIQVFQTMLHPGGTKRFIGDDGGWIYSLNRDGDGESTWRGELNLQPSYGISSMNIWGTMLVVASLGPGKILVYDFAESSPRMFILKFDLADILCSHLHDSSLVVGGLKKALYFPDINSSSGPETLQTSQRSDVFSIARDNNLIYTGARNGTITRFDLRTPRHKYHNILNERLGSNHTARSTVLALEFPYSTSQSSSSASSGGDHNRELLVSHLNGSLESYDLRFLASSSSISAHGSGSCAKPIKVFGGHVNSYTARLGLCLDRERQLLFAAGEDCRLRGWSLRTAESILALPSANSSTQEDKGLDNPFVARFSRPLTSLQVVEEPEEPGVCLWAAGDHLYQYHLGQRIVPGVR